MLSLLLAGYGGPMTASIETQVTQLVSEAFRIQHAKRITEAQQSSQEQSSTALREALLAHASIHIKRDILLSATEWKHFVPVLARVMPAIWFGVITGTWGSAKVTGSNDTKHVPHFFSLL
jgi:hypothetical protein